MKYLIAFLAGIAVGVILNNRKYRYKIGRALSWFGDWVQQTAAPVKYGKGGEPWRMEVKDLRAGTENVKKSEEEQ